MARPKREYQEPETPTPRVPVDFSVVKDFEFVDGEGCYTDKQACIMSALYLATEIAAGRITLKEALNGYVDPRDRVECVSQTLTSLCIEQNDSFDEDERAEDPELARKEWALPLLPRLLGTIRGKGLEHRAHLLTVRMGKEARKKEVKDRKQWQKDHEALDDQEHKEFLRTEAQKYLDTGEEQHLVRAYDNLDFSEWLAGREAPDESSDFDSDQRVYERKRDLLNAQIEAVIQFFQENP